MHCGSKLKLTLMEVLVSQVEETIANRRHESSRGHNEEDEAHSPLIRSIVSLVSVYLSLTNTRPESAAADLLQLSTAASSNSAAV